MKNPKVGDRVYWNDPETDPELSCSGAGTIQTVCGEIIGVAKDDGGWVEAFDHELEVRPA